MITAARPHSSPIPLPMPLCLAFFTRFSKGFLHKTAKISKNRETKPGVQIHNFPQMVIIGGLSGRINPLCICLSLLFAPLHPLVTFYPVLCLIRLESSFETNRKRCVRPLPAGTPPRAVVRL
jgi:hypothetical protein